MAEITGDTARWPYALAPAPDGASHRPRAVSPATLVVGRAGPHPRTRACKRSQDLEFEPILRDVADFYQEKQPDLVVLAADEKPLLQALARTQPGLPPPIPLTIGGKTPSPYARLWISIREGPPSPARLDTGTRHFWPSCTRGHLVFRPELCN